MCDSDVYGDIEYFRIFLFRELTAEIKNRNLSGSLNVGEVELVLEPKLDELGIICCYYFVNPPARSVFWLGEWEVFQGCKGTLSTPHKGKLWTIHFHALMKHLKGWLSKHSAGALHRQVIYVLQGIHQPDSLPIQLITFDVLTTHPNQLQEPLGSFPE